MCDNSAPLQEIGEYNQCARRDRAIEDQQGGGFTVRELHGAETVAGRHQPGCLHVEGEKPVARKALFELGYRRGKGPVEGRHTQAIFSPYY